MRIAGDVEYHEWDYFDMLECRWAFGCRWHRPEDKCAEQVVSYFSEDPSEGERSFLRRKARETYARHLKEAAV